MENKKHNKLGASIGQASDSDDSDTKAIRLESQKDFEMRKLHDEIEKSVSSLFKNDPMIGQNRSTVIIDELSNALEFRSKFPEKSNVSNSEEIERKGEHSPLTLPKIPIAPSSPRLKASPMNSPKISPRMLILGARVRSEGGVPLPNLVGLLPNTPMNTPRYEHNLVSFDVNKIPPAVNLTNTSDVIVGK
jgi:hypothetical protein